MKIESLDMKVVEAAHAYTIHERECLRCGDEQKRAGLCPVGAQLLEAFNRARTVQDTQQAN
jgi:hypothetical protein